MFYYSDKFGAICVNPEHVAGVHFHPTTGSKAGTVRVTLTGGGAVSYTGGKAGLVFETLMEALEAESLTEEE